MYLSKAQEVRWDREHGLMEGGGLDIPEKVVFGFRVNKVGVFMSTEQGWGLSQSGFKHTVSPVSWEYLTLNTWYPLKISSILPSLWLILKDE